MMQRGIIVGVNINNREDFEESMIELKNLCFACDIEVVGEMDQNAKQINSSYYIGSGKVSELANVIETLQVDIIIFNNELTASQLRNIEKRLKCIVIDRTTLILEIFAQRAKTREARLQVEVAKLKYALPRLIGTNISLGRQSGGVGTKNKGVGETKLELDRRRIEDKIVALNKELEILKYQRFTQRNKRKKSSIPNIALVGYTNAGKSSVMNTMLDRFKQKEDKKVFEKNMLFATLETSVRSIKLEDNKKFLLSDTVGFVSDLPHDLVKAFRSTLEEVCEADLLIHVVDVSNPNHKNHIDVTNETLKQIGAKDIPMIYAYNKVDLIDLYGQSDNGVYISAKSNIGMDELIENICSIVFKDYVKCSMLIPYSKGDIVSYLNSNANIIDTNYTDEGTILSMECSKVDYNRYNSYLI